MDKKLYQKLTIRLYKAGKCFGPGIAELLDKVAEHHSLRAAAQSMDMAYSKAWTMVKQCEAALGEKLIDRTTGGKNGGGAVPTEAALALIASYRAYCRDVNQYADAQFPVYFERFLKE